MVHVWQRQNGMHVMARRILKPFATYDYILEPGKPFHKYTMEQQATIVEDYFRSLHGVTAVKNNEKKGRIVYPPAEYEAVIPWLKKPPDKCASNTRQNRPATTTMIGRRQRTSCPLFACFHASSSRSSSAAASAAVLTAA